MKLKNDNKKYLKHAKQRSESQYASNRADGKKRSGPPIKKLKRGK